MDIVIIGGGPAGLTAAWECQRLGIATSLTLIEKEARLGGLAKSYRYADGSAFDIGPKRFHTEDPSVLSFLRKVSEGNPLMEIDRSSKVLFLNRYFTWPLALRDVFRLPATTASCAVKDLLFLSAYNNTDPVSFEQYILSKYGRTLYELFFRPYTEKFLRTTIAQIHRDWATTGIDRSIIHKEAQSNSLAQLVRKILLPPRTDMNFLYPQDGPFGSFWDLCERELRKQGAQVRTETTVEHVRKNGERFILCLSDGSELQADTVLWSGKITDLLRAIGAPLRNLPFIDTIFVDLVVPSEDVRREAITQWLYVSSALTPISRISFPRLFRPENIPGGEGLCVEVTVGENERVDTASLSRSVLESLQTLGILRRCRPQVIEVHRNTSTYPLYHRSYQEEVKAATESIESFSGSIIPFGRSGSFWYNNCDHSIKQALSIVTALAGNERSRFNPHQVFGGG